MALIVHEKRKETLDVHKELQAQHMVTQIVSVAYPLVVASRLIDPFISLGRIVTQPVFCLHAG